MGHELCESVRDMSCVSNSASMRVARFMEDGTGRVWQNSLVRLVSVLGLVTSASVTPEPRPYVATARTRNLPRGQRGRALAAHEPWARPRGCYRPSAVCSSAGG